MMDEDAGCRRWPGSLVSKDLEEVGDVEEEI
jgi:hypothetical protein